MKILYIPSWYASKSYPVLGTFFWEEAKALSNAGHEVTFLDITNVGIKDYFDFKSFKIKQEYTENILLIQFKSPDLLTYNLKFLYSIYIILKLKFILKKDILHNNYDIIHAASLIPASIVARNLSKIWKIPYIYVEHSSRYLSKKLQTFEINSISRCSSDTKIIFSVSNSLKKSLLNFIQNDFQIEVIPNMFDDMFKYSKVKDSQIFRICSIGNLIKSKRFDLTINTFKEFNKIYPNSELIIIGSGKEKNYLETLIGSNKNISFLGSINREEVKNQLEKSNIFVLPSEYETFGISFIEALAVGRPIISFLNGGSNDYITEKNGLIISENSISSLLSAIIFIKTNYQYYNQFEISKNIHDLFGSKKHVELLEFNYNLIIKNFNERIF